MIWSTRRIGMTKQALNHLLGRMQQGGYLERRGDGRFADLRRRLVDLNAVVASAGRLTDADDRCPLRRARQAMGSGAAARAV